MLYRGIKEVKWTFDSLAYYVGDLSAGEPLKVYSEWEFECYIVSLLLLEKLLLNYSFLFMLFFILVYIRIK